MTYSRDYFGSLEISPVLRAEHASYLYAFAITDRHAGDPGDLADRLDPLREYAGLDLGPGGAYYLGFHELFRGLRTVRSMGEIRSRKPPLGQPSQLCPLIPVGEGGRPALLTDFELRTDRVVGKRRFSALSGRIPACEDCPVAWLRYLDEHFLRRWGYRLDGTLVWTGHERYDCGVIEAVDSELIILDVERETDRAAGLARFGETAPNAVLTEFQAAELRKHGLYGIKAADIAAKAGPGTVYDGPQEESANRWNKPLVAQRVLAGFLARAAAAGAQ